MPRNLVIFLSVQLLGVALQAAPVQAQSADAPAVGVLIDSSAAMARKVSGVSRAATVGNALATNFVKHDSRLNMSLAVFGHSRKQGCSAVDVVQDLEPLRAATFAKTLVNLKTVGVAPLALALEAVANTLAEESSTRQVILITASTDSCKADPCKTATRINRRQPDLRINVIALGAPGSTKLDGLRCIATRTGGTFAILSGETELTAAIDTIIESTTSSTVTPEQGLSVTSIEPDISAAAGTGEQLGWATGALAPVPESAIENQLPSDDAQGTIRLVAMLTDGQKPIPAGLTWRIFESSKSVDGGYKLISEKRDWSPVLELPAGDYLVNAAYGRAHLTRRIRVSTGAPRVEPFILQAGGLRLRALDARGKPVRANVTYSVLSGERDQYGNRSTIIANVKPGLIIRLNSGIYSVISRYGDANAIVQADVTVEPGKLTQIAITHAAGTATFKLVSRPGGEAIAGTLWSIQTLDGTEIKQSQGALPSHVLAPGTYKVFAKQGDRSFAGQFQINANEKKQIEIIIK